MSHRQTDPRRIEALDQITKLIDCLVNIKDETGEYLLQLDDGRIIDTKGWNDWEWTHGIGLYGLHKFHEITGNQEALRICLEWFRSQFALGTTKNVNTMSPLLTAAYIHEAKHMNFLVHLESWAEWVMYEMPRTNQGGLQHITYLVDNNQQLWDDTLMMTVLPLAKIGRILGREHYIEEAKRQFLIHIKYLQDVKTGLWFHGWTFDGHHHFAGALWARGNCWATIAIPELIDILSLPPSDGFYMFLVAALTFQIDALVKYQDSETGLWHTIINDPTSYLEASATAGFAYGILKALRMRLIPKEERYISAANKAIQGVQANISPTGELQQVSFGTPVFDTIESYKRVQLTSMPYGQSLALLALTEYLRAFV
ncbi:glycoside hydrolase family 105 protein [Amanita thiersii Skay4041]|uniref:Glycoside hydrolase family 105 protein n=1 Tax=Amanita thiersii Skay4041 TaxID=703135 RepID=A0A2A9NZV8_9AGAR|nr:glycoside hydrolase family 105 protein [Amanita thiersii Skay4041]